MSLFNDYHKLLYLSVKIKIKHVAAVIKKYLTFRIDITFFTLQSCGR